MPETTTSDNWVEKYRPETYSAIQGNNKDVKQIRKWADGFSPGDDPQLLVGDAGVGKTTAAKVTARHLDLPLNTVDTSSARKSDDVKRIAETMQTAGQVVLLDEVDSWPGRSNLTPLVEQLKRAPCPVFLTANDEYDVPGAIKGVSNVRSFSLSTASVRAKVREIAEAEGVDLSEDELESLADRPGLRSAINDLQFFAEMGEMPDDGRAWETNKFSAMDVMIQEESTEGVDLDGGTLVAMLDANVRKEFRGLGLVLAYDALSRADIHLWRGGDHGERLAKLVADLQQTDPYGGYIKWDFPKRWRSSVPKGTDDSPEAELYRALDVSGSFREFRGVSLQLLRRRSTEERCRIAQENGVPESALSALNVSKSEFKDYLGVDDVETGEALHAPTEDISEVDW